MVMGNRGNTIRSSDEAMEHEPFMDDVPMKNHFFRGRLLDGDSHKITFLGVHPIFRGRFLIATFDCWRVLHIFARYVEITIMFLW